MKPLKTILKSTLIIDYDDIENANFINIFIEHGLSLDIVTPQKDFLSIIKKNKIDCVMIYSDQPDNMAYKIIDAIKTNYPWVVVIILLQNPDYKKIFGFIRQGADDFILSPFTWDDVENVLLHYYY